MAKISSLTKIRDMHDNEKQVAQKAYAESQETFEKIAKELYNLLKKKEIAESSFENAIQASTSIEKIKEQSAYIEKLTNQIQTVQLLVQRARNDMNTKQTKLSEAYIEYKKYDKMIDLKKEKAQAIVKKQEASFMDEMSMQQFLRQNQR
ncbi:flagellar export protein FliJ [Oceanobacillus jeddahense]|uniref:Flagellar FliJ protein n=1 Tax=Oceanobacillus jeddahense TaxID=1462527 RepID=A0ABY5JP01_9BACI|nr:flagellar export protein FliJ [Oceanobacillus jeddahense]UUI01540.1 flagellar export protein FliJ [Oceanobacillus jeddahense]